MTLLDKKVKEILLAFSSKLVKFYELPEPYAFPSVVYMESRKAVDDYWKRKTEDWLVAWSKQDTIYILHPDVYTKESSHKDSGLFWNTLKHEFAHVYFEKYIGTNKPKWLNEGLACYLAGQIKKSPNGNLDMNLFYNKGGADVYAFGYWKVNYLIEKYGKKKLVNFLSNIKNTKNSQQFTEIFDKFFV